MTAPDAPPAGLATGGHALSISLKITTLTQRRDFLAAAQARRAAVAGFLLQARARSGDEAPDLVRLGFTCSKKLGNAVTRNRAKRRLRALAADLVPGLGRPGWDYVLVGKPGATVDRPFDDLRADLRKAFARIHG